MILGLLSLAFSILLVLTGTLLLWLSGFSAPFIRSIYYLGLAGGSGDRLGTFGYCTPASCLSHHVGYVYPLVPNSNSLTGSLILTPIAAGVGSIALIALVCSFRWKNLAIVSFGVLCFAAFLAVLSYILALSAFVTAHRRYASLQARPHYGPAMWMHLTGMLVYLIALPFTFLAWLRRPSKEDEVRFGSDANSNVTYNSSSHLNSKKSRKAAKGASSQRGQNLENEQTVSYLDRNDNNNMQNLNQNQNLNQMNRQEMTHVPYGDSTTTSGMTATPIVSGAPQSLQGKGAGAGPNANMYQPVQYQNQNPYPYQNQDPYPYQYQNQQNRNDTSNVGGTYQTPQV